MYNSKKIALKNKKDYKLMQLKYFWQIIKINNRGRIEEADKDYDEYKILKFYKVMCRRGDPLDDFDSEQNWFFLLLFLII